MCETFIAVVSQSQSVPHAFVLSVFMPPHICALCLLFFLSTDKKKQICNLWKTQAMYFVTYFNRGIFISFVCGS